MSLKQNFVISRGQYCDSDDEEIDLRSYSNLVELKVIVKSSAKNAIILLNDVANVLLYTLIKEKYLGVVATICCNGEVVSNVYCKHSLDQNSATEEVLVIHNLKNNLDAQIVNNWILELLKLEITNYIVIDALHLNQLPMDNYPNNVPPLYLLETNQSRSVMFAKSTALSTANNIPLLPNGVILSGAVAALVNTSEIYKSNCICILIPREAAYTVEAGQAIESIWPLLEYYWGGDCIQKPLAAEYMKQRKHDSYLHMTANLYT